VDAWSAHAAELLEEVRRVEGELGDMSARAEESAATAGSLQEALEESERRYDESERRYDAIVHSASFRITAPLRRLRALLRSGSKA
jgi:hypothetical protein